ncbi:uncharacterized protein B0T23DRAFT_387368 [Neurospora hispaniola]|uniref:Uncharacterized protein n=1 Tax=Neurospora hispaniola TaxID=588809 RepID=A0AAJ0I2J8_9PEZI|nr:hypothetical protein B0T23DRAFT_387368 [Neurospora hispaniola]
MPWGAYATQRKDIQSDAGLFVSFHGTQLNVLEVLYQTLYTGRNLSRIVPNLARTN